MILQLHSRRFVHYRRSTSALSPSSPGLALTRDRVRLRTFVVSLPLFDNATIGGNATINVN